MKMKIRKSPSSPIPADEIVRMALFSNNAGRLGHTVFIKNAIVAVKYRQRWNSTKLTFLTNFSD